MKVGYFTNSRGQEAGASMARRLRAAGCVRVFKERAGKGAPSSAMLRKLLDEMRAGDVLVVTRLEQIARTVVDLLAIAKTLETKQALLRSLDEGWADMTGADGRVVVAVLTGLDDLRSQLVRVRMEEGRRAAGARGQHMGRPFALTPHQRDEARRRLSDGELPSVVAKSYNVSRSTITRLSRGGE